MKRLIFFCELDRAEFCAFFDDGAVAEQLSVLGAGISVGLRDLSPERAQVLRRLTDAGIPLMAWLLLPEDEGYWLNVNNAPEATARYHAFREWTATYQLKWEAVGLDVEFDMRELRALMADRRRIAPTLWRNLTDTQRLNDATAAYQSLAHQIRVDGYLVESYVIPFALDERRAGATLLQRLFGLVETPIDREAPMLYSSFLRPHGVGVLWSYAREAGMAGVGSTGGGVTFGGADQITPLSWDEFARDLRIAHRWCQAIYVFSLEGCVRQGFLARLHDFDWDAPVVEPVDAIQRVERFRAALRAFFWLSANPAPVLAVLAGGIALAWAVTRKRAT